MMPVFIGERITVQADGIIKQPVSFVWRKHEYRVEDIILSWFDWGFPAGATQRDWKSRRHRTYFRVATQTGEKFELYLDRGSSRSEGVWYLFQKLDEADGGKQPSQ